MYNNLANLLTVCVCKSSCVLSVIHLLVSTPQVCIVWFLNIWCLDCLEFREWDDIVTTKIVRARCGVGVVVYLPPNTPGCITDFNKEAIFVDLYDGDPEARNFYWAIVSENEIEKVDNVVGNNASIPPTIT
jgi:hypothetical protein